MAKVPSKMKNNELTDRKNGVVLGSEPEWHARHKLGVRCKAIADFGWSEARTNANAHPPPGLSCDAFFEAGRHFGHQILRSENAVARRAATTKKGLRIRCNPDKTSGSFKLKLPCIP